MLNISSALSLKLDAVPKSPSVFLKSSPYLLLLVVQSHKQQDKLTNPKMVTKKSNNLKMFRDWLQMF